MEGEGYWVGGGDGGRAGGTAGCVTWAMVYPLDTVKVREMRLRIGPGDREGRGGRGGRVRGGCDDADETRSRCVGEVRGEVGGGMEGRSRLRASGEEGD